MMIIDDWLEDRIHEHRFLDVIPDDVTEFAMLAGILRARAVSEGYRVELLEDACGGDVTAYLMAQHAVVAGQRPQSMSAPQAL